MAAPAIPGDGPSSPTQHERSPPSVARRGTFRRSPGTRTSRRPSATSSRTPGRSGESWSWCEFASEASEPTRWEPRSEVAADEKTVGGALSDRDRHAAQLAASSTGINPAGTSDDQRVGLLRTLERPSIHAPGCGKISTKSAFIKFPIGNSDGSHIDINRVQKMMPEKIRFGGRAHSQKIMGPFQQVFESL
jgi:hypothetical protein